MNIQEAKEQIENAMKVYFAKDEYGAYRLKPEKQRPVFLIGAPGIGKTAIMEQIARDMNVGFVSYSMTHHTRQSALGLPFITQKDFDGKTYDVSEYTMSEIIAAVYENMETTGRREGILFLDEINCVSETLTPAMLQFLQYKVFGRHRVPDGWIVVTAGNPPEYNRTVHDFDIATWDRLKRIDVEPDFPVWHRYAVATGVHPSVITFLDIERDCFYHMEKTVDGMRFVTARGWDDLSSMIILYEEQGIPVNNLLIEQYVQDEEIARRFFAYYNLFTKYRSDYQIDDILEGKSTQNIRGRARNAAFDERISLCGLIADAICRNLGRVQDREAACALLHSQLASYKDAENLAAAIEADCAAMRARIETMDGAGLVTQRDRISASFVANFFAQAQDTYGKDCTFDQLKSDFAAVLDDHQASIDNASQMLDNAFAFVEEVFGDSQEALLLVTDLSANKDSMAFIRDNGCPRYFALSEQLQFQERGGDLAARIDQLNLAEE